MKRKSVITAGAILACTLALTISTLSGCDVFDTFCPTDKVCPDDTPYWGGGSYCYESLSYCESLYDRCEDCRD